MDIIEKARELGGLIAASEELLRLKRAEDAIVADERSKKLFEEYKELQRTLVHATKQRMSREIVEEHKKSLMEKQRELNEYKPTKEYLDSKMGFDRLIKTVNDVIMFTITGEEQCQSSSCGSCGKCK